MENSMEVPQKIKNSVPIWHRNPSSGYLPSKFENMYLLRHMYTYVHCDIIHGGQDMETTKVSCDRWLDKKDVVHIYYRILLRHNRRWNTAIRDNMDGSWEYHARQNKSDRKSQSHMISLNVCIKLKATDDKQEKQTNKNS